ncbi:type II toxin-antitoxin system Phd/YefM family antitoxin [Deinococcus misasensis]|uniref:type II toxin-antitoxin system Phd/YefM family antitoxin n=1 Tax=Deinococcus misasensis TaxID=392413 RepID=UPI00054F5D59|nr:type II toxin-antitoxin system prevent-host-death family antitoxin [Deinococcus misasensis]
MTQVNMHEAKTRLSQLVQDTLNGEEVIIARDGEPLVQLIPIEGVERQSRKKKNQWPKAVMDFKGIPDLTPFEAHREELRQQEDIEL